MSAFKIFCLKNKPVPLSGEKQEAAAAVELTSLFALVSNAVERAYEPSFKQKVVP